MMGPYGKRSIKKPATFRQRAPEKGRHIGEMGAALTGLLCCNHSVSVKTKARCLSAAGEFWDEAASARHFTRSIRAAELLGHLAEIVGGGRLCATWLFRPPDSRLFDLPCRGVDVLRGHGSAEIVTLSLTGAVLAHSIKLLTGFDAFGDDDRP
jgi:hypothetical protein